MVKQKETQTIPEPIFGEIIKRFLKQKIRELSVIFAFLITPFILIFVVNIGWDIGTSFIDTSQPISSEDIFSFIFSYGIALAVSIGIIAWLQSNWILATYREQIKMVGSFDKWVKIFPTSKTTCDVESCSTKPTIRVEKHNWDFCKKHLKEKLGV